MKIFLSLTKSSSLLLSSESSSFSDFLSDGVRVKAALLLANPSLNLNFEDSEKLPLSLTKILDLQSDINYGSIAFLFIPKASIKVWQEISFISLNKHNTQVCLVDIVTLYFFEVD